MATITKVQTPDGVTHNIGGGGSAITYNIGFGSASGNTVPLVLTGSDSSTDTVYFKGAGTATLSVSGDTLTVTTSGGQSVTYTLSGSGDSSTYTITNTPSSGTASSATIPSATTSDAGVMSAADKTKLNGIESGAEVNVQSDWSQSNSSADDFIKNKPSLATVATSGDYNDLSNKPNLATVATTGDYDDLSNKPTIPTVNDGTLTIQKNGTTIDSFTANQSGNTTVNVTVPTATSELTNDSDFVASTSLAPVATSGDYDDLTNKPSIPTVNDATLTIQKNGTTVETFTANSSTNKTANITVPQVSVTQVLSSGTKIAEVDIDGTTTDLYAPSGGGGGVSDVEVNGVSVVTGGVAQVTVPTATSDLTNDSNFVSDASYVHTDNNFTNSDASKLSGIQAGAEVNVQADWTQADSTADDYIKNKPTPITFNDIYPVGSIYMSINNVNPGTLFGGTWTQIQDTFLLAAGSTYAGGSTGGEATHTLTEAELPNITGSFQIRRIYNENNHIVVGTPTGHFSRSNSSLKIRPAAYNSSTTEVAEDTVTYEFGSGNAHENMPPYLAVYVWQRTA